MKYLSILFLLALCMVAKAQTLTHEMTIGFSSHSYQTDAAPIHQTLDSLKAAYPNSNISPILIHGYSWETTSILGVPVPLCGLRSDEVKSIINKWEDNQGQGLSLSIPTNCTTTQRSGPASQKVVVRFDIFL